MMDYDDHQATFLLATNIRRHNHYPSTIHTDNTHRDSPLHQVIATGGNDFFVYRRRVRFSTYTSTTVQVENTTRSTIDNIRLPYIH